jgi:hypothetical protein
MKIHPPARPKSLSCAYVLLSERDSLARENMRSESVKRVDSCKKNKNAPAEA